MKKNIIIVLLIIIILGLGGYLVFDKVMDNKEETPIEEGNNQIKEDNKESGVIVNDLINGKVIQTFSSSDGMNIELEANEIPYVEVILPYININSSAAKEINNKIETKFSNEINIIKNNVTTQVSNKGPYYTSINYSYTVRNNVLFIYVEKLTNSYRASGYSEGVAYYYDLENNKILSTEETLKKLGKTVEEVKEKINSNYDSNFIDNKEETLRDLDNNVSIVIVANTILIKGNTNPSFQNFEI